MKVIKRDGTTVDFDRNKIVTAIKKANSAVDEEHRVNDEQIEQIVCNIEKKKKTSVLNVSEKQNKSAFNEKRKRQKKEDETKKRKN